MSKRARDRQLAKLAQRRAAERRAARRRRSVIFGGAGVVAATALLLVGFDVLAGNDPDDGISPSPSVSATPEPGIQTGTVEPGTAPKDVACGGRKPRDADAPKPQFSAPPAMTIDETAAYTATFQTSCGDVVIRLLPRRAPQTVNSFVFLAREGYFDGTFFHRLDTSIDVIQGGDPTGTGSGDPGYSIPDELKGDETYGPGTLAMANAGPGTGGSQFFLITGEAGHNLDGSPDFTVFGRVIDGLDVARRIQGLRVEDPDAGIEGQRPTQAIYLEKVRIREKAGPSPSATPSATPSG
jgi:cyclophilin family peptidyl-prolyl cis-trans isomerase